MEYTKDLSIVISLYNEEESLPELIKWIEAVMERENYNYEVIMVDDGSTDKSWATVNELAAKNPAIRGISFRRNYGKSAALYHGFAATEGKVVITMDADLQDSPEEIPELYRMVTEEGWDIVSGWKKETIAAEEEPLVRTNYLRLSNRHWHIAKDNLHFLSPI